MQYWIKIISIKYNGVFEENKMNELTFNNWWNEQERYKEKDQSFKEEALKGWQEASIVEDLSLIRGLGAYCEGWNAKMRIRKSI